GCETMENHLLLRGPQVSRPRCGQVRAQGGARVDQGTRRRDRRGLPGGLRKDGRGARVALVRDAGDVPETRVPESCLAWDERLPSAEDDFSRNTRTQGAH